MVGAVSPAFAAMSVKWALKGLPDGASFACAFAVWVDMPWPNRRVAEASSGAPRESCSRARRVSFIRCDRLNLVCQNADAHAEERKAKDNAETLSSLRCAEMTLTCLGQRRR